MIWINKHSWAFDHFESFATEKEAEEFMKENGGQYIVRTGDDFNWEWVGKPFEKVN